MTKLQEFYYWIRDLASDPRERGESSAGYWQGKIRRITVFLCQDLRGRVLEVGCGEGLFLSQLMSRYPTLEVWGVDAGSEILERARRRLDKQPSQTPVRLIKGDARNLPFADLSFDAVVGINLLMCLPDLKAVETVVAEMTRVCKPGGRLLIELRNKANVLLRLKYGLARYYDASVRHHPLSTFHEHDIVAILKKNGFVVRQARHVDFPIKRWAPIIILEAQKNV